MLRMRHNIKIVSVCRLKRIYASLLWLMPALFVVPALHAQTVLSGFGTPVIDGQIRQDEWSEAASVKFDVKTPKSAGGRSVPGKFLVMNDAINLYLAIQFDAAEEGNSASFHFDEELRGYRAPGDDLLLINPSPLVGFLDSHISPEYYGISDVDDGGEINGEGSFSNEGGQTSYEFSHPLDSGDYLHDFSLRPGKIIAFSMSIRLIDAETDLKWPDNGADTELYPRGSTDGWGKIRILGQPTALRPGNDMLLRARAALLKRCNRSPACSP